VSSRILIGRPSDAQLGEQLLGTTWRPGGAGWRLAFGIAGSLTVLLVALITYTVGTGIGVWGTMIPVGWAFAIINFVWWIGIGHAGTFISAILYLFEQRWRTSINRLAEAMTLFAVLQAALFPVLHLGRPWFAYWLFPYPSQMEVWPQVKSALPWDAAAVSTYFTVSLVFWYLGLIPDLASMRDHAPTRRRRFIYGLFALGWSGKATTWRHYKAAYLVLAGLATPLVLSVHSVVSSDFATGLTPGWHSTIFPPYFVAGAIFSGFAMVLTLIIPVRAVFRLHNVITEKHLENCAKLMLVTGLIVSYGYILEGFFDWYSGERAEWYQGWVARPTGPGFVLFYLAMLCNVVVPQLLWWKQARTKLWLLWPLSILINVGMWSERFMIIVQSLEREYLPSMWGDYLPTWVDLGILLGTFGFFTLLFMMFLRFVPIISLSEMRDMKHDIVREEAGHA
jgi:molybdopterin-containing oxidoreductase family membrane subunit